ncbi:MAG: barstar family protein [bacterium]|nr:barstar family protein [bacterium]
MGNWGKRFGDLACSGVYTIAEVPETSEIGDLAASKGLAFFHVDFGRVWSKKSFLRRLARDLQFPPYFGENWDAFEECLNDMAWAPAPGYVILLENWETFARRSPGEMETALSIFEDATLSWSDEGNAFFVLLREK